MKKIIYIFLIPIVIGVAIKIITPVKATEIFTNNIDSYNLYQSLGTQNPTRFSGEDPGYAYATTTVAHTGTQSFFVCDNTITYDFDTIGSEDQQYTVSFYISSNVDGVETIYLKDDSNKTIATILIDDSPKEIRIIGDTNIIELEYNSYDTWNTLYFIISPLGETIKGRLNSEEWSETVVTDNNASTFHRINITADASCSLQEDVAHYYDSFISTYGDYSVEFTYPSGSTTPDFSTWKLSYYITTAPFSGYITVKYGETGTTTSEDTLHIIAITEGEAPINISKSTVLSTSTEYNATAYLYSVNNTLLATSEEIIFTVSDDPFYENDYYDTVYPSPTMTCSESLGVVERYICRAFVYLFIPDPTVYNNFMGLKDIVIQKAPFAYFNLVKDTFANIELDASSTYPSLLVNMDLGNGTTAVAILDFSEMPIEENNLADFRTALIYLLWITFGFYLLNRPLELLTHKD